MGASNFFGPSYFETALVHSNFDLVSSVLDLDATEKVSQTVTEMVVKLKDIHLTSVQETR